MALGFLNDSSPCSLSFFSVTNRSLMLQVLMLCSGLPVTNSMFEFMDGIFSFEGQGKSIL